MLYLAIGRGANKHAMKTIVSLDSPRHILAFRFDCELNIAILIRTITNVILNCKGYFRESKRNFVRSSCKAYLGVRNLAMPILLDSLLQI